MSPAVVLDMLAGLGGSVDRVLIVGCQPATVDEGIGLSEPVAVGIDRGCDAVDESSPNLCPRTERNSRA